MNKEYKKLDKSLTEDKELLTELAEAMTERNAIKKRLAYLDTMIEENSEFIPAIWTTLNGTSLPIYSIPDDHLKNIGLFLAKRGSGNRRIYKELVARFGVQTLPEGISEDDDDDVEF